MIDVLIRQDGWISTNIAIPKGRNWFELAVEGNALDKAVTRREFRMVALEGNIAVWVEQ